MALALLGEIEMGVGIVGGGRLDQAGEHAGLPPGETLRRRAEVPAGCVGEAVEAVAVVHGSQVHAKDLVLRVAGVELEGKLDLLDSGDHVPAARRVEVLGELDLDGGGSRVPAAREAAGHCPEEADGIDAEVAREPAVLRGDDGLAHVVGDRKGREATGAVGIQDVVHQGGGRVHRGGERPETQDGAGRQGNDGEGHRHKPQQPPSPVDLPAWCFAVHGGT